MPKQNDEFACLLSMPDLGKFVGKWIAIINNAVVSSGNVGKEVFAEAKQKYPDSKPLLVKVPSDSVMLM